MKNDLFERNKEKTLNGIVTQILSGPNGKEEPRTLLATYADPSPRHRNRRRPPGHLEILAVTENGGRRRRPPRAGALWERGGASSLITRDRCSSGLLLHMDRSLCTCVLALCLRRWWYSSPTSGFSPPLEPSSRGSSSTEPYSPTPPASTTAATVPPAAADPRILWAAS